MSVGGSIQEVSINGRIFAVAADADGTRKLGGFENAIESNGDGSARTVKTRVPWMFSGLVLDIDLDRADQEFLQDIADGVNADPDGFYPMSITLASGHTYGGKGTIVEALEGTTNNTTATVSLCGPGKLELQ